ncbi:MAG: BMP family ABC transporter substrate-binding protein [Actinobacteria bacterium]|nr:BMP family ABC transporter substrate-binding protein [Actinomycetota bacterium]
MKWFAALFMVLALFVAACAEEDEPTDAGGDNGAEETDNSDFLACQVTDTGGVDDRSFNQTAYKGLEDAEDEFGIEIQVLESQNPNDFEPNIQSLIQQDCDIIVTVGFLLGDATAAAAEANPDKLFAIVDFDFFDADAGEDISFDNVKELTFATDEAAFLAGYVAAGTTETGKLGTYGGINIPTVTIFMDGFQAGMEHFNSENGGDVVLEGWDSANPEGGLFTGDFENQDNGRQVTETLLGEDVDIVMPVAGPVGLGSAAAVQDAGEGSLVWVDTDGCVSVEEFCDLFLTSVMKNMDVAVFTAVEEALNDEFEGGLYTGTLENEGVGIAPFHEFEDTVSDDIKTQVEELRQQIIDGEVTVGQG